MTNEFNLEGQIEAGESILNCIDDCEKQNVPVSAMIVKGILQAFIKQKQKELEEMKLEQRARLRKQSVF